MTRPSLAGQTDNGQSIWLGGFSGIWVTDRKGDQIHVLAMTDRGPNGDANGDRRPFLLPDFQPRIVKLRIDLSRRTADMEGEIPLRNGEKSFTGRPLPRRRNGPAMEVPIEPGGRELPADADGIDPESLCRAGDGSFWVGEEYGPDLLHFSSDGQLLRRYGPGNGLPEWLSERKINSGFEGVACAPNAVFAVLQTPLARDAPGNSSVRLVQFDPLKEKVVAEFSYPLDASDHKIGDLFSLGNGRFIIIEQNGKPGTEAFQRVFEFTLGAPIYKRQVLDLVQKGYRAEKAEGLFYLDGGILVISDNDFSLSEKPRRTRIGFFKINLSKF